MHTDWEAKRDWANGEHRRRSARPTGPDEREDFRLAGIAGASWAAGLAAAMLGDDDEAASPLPDFGLAISAIRVTAASLDERRGLRDPGRAA